MYLSLVALVGVAVLGLLARAPLRLVLIAAPMATFLALPSLWSALAVVAGVCLSLLLPQQRSF